jgi:K+-sensing histidine kinase KdpD
MIESVHQRGTTAAAAGLITVAVVTGVLRAVPGTNPTTVALTFLLVVLFVASAGPLWAAVVTSVGAMLCFNYFFLPPVGTWHIHDSQNWVALAALLVTSIVASQLSARARARADERRRADIATERAELSSALLASMGHDLRTPLTALRVAVENLSDAALDPSARDEQARLARRQAEHLTHVFDAILDMARIESKSVEILPEWCAVGEIVGAAIAHVGPALEQHRLTIDVPPEEVHLDPRLTAASVARLLENAAQYAAAGTSIDVRATVDADGLRIAVTDEGPGLDEAEIGQLFSPSFRGRTGQSGRHGTGMGLAIARGLVAVQGGRVTAEKDAGGGARFEIIVPAMTRAARLQPEVT